MKLKTYIFILLAVITFACDSSDDGDSGNKTYEFYNDALMSLAISQGEESSLEIEAGEKTVFKYHFVSDDNPNISDDEYAESIYFEVDSNLDSFSYTNAELQDHKLLINRSCFCNYFGIIFSNVGSISGTKLNNGNWDIDINMTYELGEASETRTISGVFRSTPIPN